MSRRVSLPAADDLFRPTAVPDTTSPAAPAPAEPAPEPGKPARPARKASRTSSGRVRHDEKMTVYITSEELLELEHARLSLRRLQGLAVDRGRLVREAVAIVLADYEANGDDSTLVQRLNGS